MAAQCISKVKQIQADAFRQEDDVYRVLLIDLMTQGTTINADVTFETLRKLRRAIQNKRRSLLSYGVLLLHDNARPHTAARTIALGSLRKPTL
jgi:hypothetical protein